MLRLRSVCDAQVVAVAPVEKDSVIHTTMLQDDQVGDGPLWVTHIVVGTPWFITQTDSAGCLLRCCRWGSKKHTKQNSNNKKRELSHSRWNGGHGGGMGQR